MFCPRCKLDVGDMDFCENCGGTTIELSKKEANEKGNTKKSNWFKYLISGVVGVILIIVIIVAFNKINKPKPITIEEAFKEYYDTSNKETFENEIVKPQISQETTDELTNIADEFIVKYYSNTPKEDYEQLFSLNSKDFYNDPNDIIKPFEFERSKDDKTEIKNIKTFESSLVDDTHATIKVVVNIIRDGYDYSKINELSEEDAIIRIEDNQTFIFEFENVEDNWFILKVSKPLI